MPSSPLWKSRAFWTTVVTALCITGLGMGVLAGNNSLDWYAGQYRAKAVRIAFDWPVYGRTLPGPDGVRRTWLPRQIQEQLVATARDHLTDNPLDRDALRRTAEALNASGWFSRINAVHRVEGGIVHIDADWREGVAVVRIGNADRLISSNAELLPVDYPPGESRLRIVFNPGQPAPATFGAPWPGEDVQAGLELLAYLQSTGLYSQIAGVDVADFAIMRRLSLVTTTGARIVWGAPPSSPSFSEPAPQTKVAWLWNLKNSPRFGHRIDAGKPLVDVSNPRGVMVDQSMVTDPASTGG